MPTAKQDKILAILKDECAQIPERTPAYRPELLETLADIVRAEREHLIRSTEIQKQVTAFCERLGDSLAPAPSKKRKRET